MLDLFTTQVDHIRLCINEDTMREYYTNHVDPPFTSLKSKYFPPIQSKENINWEEFAEKYDEAQNEMKLNHIWYEDGHNYNFRRATHKKIALGRAPFYVQFVDFYYEKYGQRLYLLDFMLRQESLNGQDSLLYYIEDAEEIHVNLEGVLVDELEYSTIGIGRLAVSKGDIGTPYATAWEINQLFYKNLLGITWFHTGSSMYRHQAYMAMGRKVPLKRIRNDNRSLLKTWHKSTRNTAKNEDIEEL